MIKPVDFDVSTFDGSIDVNALGQAIDSTWGRTSTPKTHSYSVKFSIVGGNLQVSYAAIVNFASEREMIMMKRRYAEEAKAVVASAIKEVKRVYKDLTGATLKTKENATSDSIEIISNSFSSPKRTAYYRSKVLFDLAG